MADSIRADSESFIGSPMHQLEQLIINPSIAVNFNTGLDLVKDDEELSNSFITLDVPKFGGKTQSAFVFDSIRPLYFTACRTEMKLIQPIYLNFFNLSYSLYKYATADLEIIKKVPYLNVSDKYCHINEEKEFKKRLIFCDAALKQNHSATELLVLGFLIKLVEDGKENYDNLDENKPPWMKYHSEKKNFYFRKSTIDDLSNRSSDFFNGYCLFLDEFNTSDDDTLLYILNLSRVIGLKCIVSNSEEEKSKDSFVRKQEKRSIYSIVVNRLNPISPNVLNSVYGLDEILETILKKFHNSIKPEVCEYLKNFKLELIKSFRGGVVIEIVKILKQFMFVDIPFRSQLIDLLEYLIKNLSVFLFPKRNIQSHEHGGNLYLNGPYLYQSFEVSKAIPNSGRTCLSNHLDYLINPVDNTKWLFLTYSNLKDMTLTIREKCDKFVEWFKYRCFDSNEILLNMTLQSMSLKSDYTIASDSKSLQEHYMRMNIFMCLSGVSRCEISSAAISFAVIEASRISCDTIKLGGQYGINFIRNILINIEEDSSYKKYNYTTVEYESETESSSLFDLEKYFENFKVPFFYTYNTPIPETLLKISSNNPIDEKVHIGNFIYVNDFRKFDAMFEFYELVEARNKIPNVSVPSSYEKFYGMIECKGWKNPVNNSVIMKTVQNAIKLDKFKLVLLFCHRCCGFLSPPKKCLNYFKSNKVNLFRATTDPSKLSLSSPLESRNYIKFVPHYKNDDLKHAKDPKMIFIIVELASVTIERKTWKF